MYDPLLDTLLTVAEDGSFTKAAERLYLSPTAVMKQINTLEGKLGMKLLERTPSGAKLTPAGEVIRRHAVILKEYAASALAEARAAEERYDTTFCVGTSLLNPAKPFMDIWYRVNRDFPDYKLHLVPFEDNHDGILSEIGGLGKKFDFLVGVCDSRAWLSLCNFLPLGEYRKMIAVPREHPLAEKEKLTLADLSGEVLMMVPRGGSGINDKIRADLEKDHPEILLSDTPRFYDLSVFNRAAEEGHLLLSVECWRDVHPGFVTLPVEWEYTIPYGLLYAKDAPEDVIRFVKAAENLG
ncbi:MAG TPA: LysR family transcriptional regulator [Clostridiales bacterium]|nr:LysR family transcriptional regulator [Clostridiales bacterium]